MSFSSEQARIGRRHLLRAKGSRSAEAAEAAAWGGRNDESLRSLSNQTVGLRCSASNGWASAPALSGSYAARPFLGVRSWVAEDLFNRLGTPHFGRPGC
jgi:hypothetical protein